MIAALFFASALTVVDGGMLRVNGEPIRLLGIEAPEIISRCRKRKACQPDSSQQSRESLKHALRDPITIVPVVRDAYGRTVAIVYAGGAQHVLRTGPQGHGCLQTRLGYGAPPGQGMPFPEKAVTGLGTAGGQSRASFAIGRMISKKVWMPDKDSNLD